MNRDKQIEEMARETMEMCRIDNQCGSCHWETCNECLAEALYNAGYRKASEVAREIFAEIEKTTNDAIRICNRYAVIPMLREAKTSCYKDMLGYIEKLKKKYESEGEKNGTDN